MRNKITTIAIAAASFLVVIFLFKFFVWDKYSIYKDSDVSKLEKKLKTSESKLIKCDSLVVSIGSDLTIHKSFVDSLQFKYKFTLDELAKMKKNESSAQKYLDKLQENNLIDTVKVYVQVKEAWIGKKKTYVIVNPKDVINIK